MKKLYSISLLSLFMIFSIHNVEKSYAQSTQVVEGVVKSIEDELPIPGASILVQGTVRGVTTDLDGEFSINASSGDVLVISFIGYESKRIEIIDDHGFIEVFLEQTVSTLDELVVLGYGSQRRSDVTAAISEVDLTTIADVSVSNPSRLLQGQAAGVVVGQTSGLPGEEFEVRIRGVSSLGAGSEPLYVVDGFPVGNSLGQTVNARDIESITVLKDAASTSIYGARGANGVVLITTKQADEGASRISFTSTVGFQNVPDSRRVRVLNATEFAQFQNERIGDNIRRAEGREPLPNEIPEAWRNPEQYGEGTDWLGEIINQNSAIQDYQLSISSGTEDTRSLVSIGYLTQDGSIIETDFERFSGRVNLDRRINEYVNIRWNTSGSLTNRNAPGEYDSNFTRSVINAALLMDPRDPVRNPDGSFNNFIGGRDGTFGYFNPVQRLNEETLEFRDFNVTSNVGLEVNPIENLSIRTLGFLGYSDGSRRQFRPSTIAFWNNAPPTLASGNETDITTINYGIDNVASYNHQIENQIFDITAGLSYQEESTNLNSADGSQFPDDLIPYISNAAETQATTDISEWSLVAFFGRVNYSLYDRYLASFTYRREGSSRFGANNRWGNFPSASIGWRVSEESFFPELNLINDLKLRASWGITGNNNIGNFSHLARLVDRNYVLGSGLVGGKVLNNFGNANLAWETSNQIDVGLDLTMLDGRLSFVAEVYRKTTEDMLLSVDVPAVTGFTSVLTNIGKVENKGLEFSLNYQQNISSRLRFSSNFNIAFNRNEILEINDRTNELFMSSNYYGANQIFRVGEPIGLFYGFDVIGIFETEEQIANNPSHPNNTVGTYQYRDVNGDGVITYDFQDWTIIGDPHPDFTWGWNFNVDYRRFDVSLGIVGAQNFDLYRQIEHGTMNVDGVFNTDVKMMDRWRSPDNPQGGKWAGTGNFQFTREANSRFVYDASYIWLRNISIGYSLPRLANQFDLRIFSTIDNVAMFTSYPGNNPQSNSGDPLNPQIVQIGVDNEVFPVPRVINFGINLNF